MGKCSEKDEKSANKTEGRIAAEGETKAADGPRMSGAGVPKTEMKTKTETETETETAGSLPEKPEAGELPEREAVLTLFAGEEEIREFSFSQKSYRRVLRAGSQTPPPVRAVFRIGGKRPRPR